MTSLRFLNIEPEGYSVEARKILEEIATVDEIPLERHGLLEKISHYDALIIRLKQKIDQDVMTQGQDRLKAIVTATTGVDHIDMDAAQKNGIAVLSLRGETEFLREIRATAEHTWGLLLSLIRKLPFAFQSVQQGQWQRDYFRGNELYEKTLGIIGYGRLGERVSEFGHAFGMKILAYDPYKDLFPSWITPCNQLKDLLRKSDVVSLHVPLNQQTENLMNQENFGSMKSNALFINTSRGAIVDEVALLQALKSKKLSGAALDVLQNEFKFEQNESHPLVEYSKQNQNLLITPHVGGATYESMTKTEVFMAQKLRNFFE